MEGTMTNFVEGSDIEMFGSVDIWKLVENGNCPNIESLLLLPEMESGYRNFLLMLIK